MYSTSVGLVCVGSCRTHTTEGGNRGDPHIRVDGGGGRVYLCINLHARGGVEPRLRSTAAISGAHAVGPAEERGSIDEILVGYLLGPS